MRRGKTMKVLERERDAFNAKYKVGDRVRVRRDMGEYTEHTIRHEATILGGHTVVAWLEGIVGCYLAERVRPLPKVVSHV